MQPTIGLIELPELGLFDTKGNNWLSLDRGNALISKQILLANLQGAGFDAQLVNLNRGDYQEEFGTANWGGTKFIKVYLGEKIGDIDPLAYDAWGVTNNFAQFREIAHLTIARLASRGRPVVVGGSDVIAEPESYLAAGASVLVLDKSGAANAPVMDYVLGRPPREELSGVMLANGNGAQPPLRVKQAMSPQDWPLPDVSVARQCLGTRYKGVPIPDSLLPTGSIFADLGCDRKCDFCQTPKYRIGYRPMSPERTLAWYAIQKQAGAKLVNSASDQFLGRILKKGGREDILETMRGIRELGMAYFWSNGLELKKATLGRGVNRKEGMDLTPDQELIDALWGWDGKVGCYLAYVPAERPIFGQENYTKLLPWREHCEILRAITRAGVPYIRYGVIIGFADDSQETLLRLEEAISVLYEDLITINPKLNFQVSPFTISPIPGTPQSDHLRSSGLLHFDDPTIFGNLWTAAVDTRYLGYKEVADWQMRLTKIGRSRYMEDGAFRHVDIF
uniref:Radical SAM protein n=1 Tax=Candidatus Kentrum sp. DK TaxID=2126562 RepID=A0A450SMR0_9GAMM|nr:MAG: hypothetical protein BECKDK2373C_GA0170839_10468 [Candidatus Kentron sp. DK]